MDFSKLIQNASWSKLCSNLTNIVFPSITQQWLQAIPEKGWWLMTALQATERLQVRGRGAKGTGVTLQRPTGKSNFTRPQQFPFTSQS